MTPVAAALVVATFLCSLVAGFLFAFAAVMMPGISRLDDEDFIRAFQVVDGVIQRNQPLFVLVWLGSILAIVTAAVVGLVALGGADRVLVIASAILYGVGVQLPTFIVNIPLNNALQRLDPGAMNEAERKRARETFEPRWNRWNVIRAACASLVCVLLLVLLARQ